MNKIGRGLIQTAAIAGAIVTGLAINTTGANAAELVTADVETTEVAEAQGEVSEEQQAEENIQKMEDAVEVIEGDAVAEEGYLQEAQEKADNGELTETVAEDIAEGGKTVLDQAAEKMEQVNALYEEAEADSINTEEQLSEMAEADPENYAELNEKVKEADTTEQKIEAVDEAIESLDAKHEEVSKAYEEKLEDLDVQIEGVERYIEEIRDSRDALLSMAKHNEETREAREQLEAEYNPRKAELERLKQIAEEYGDPTGYAGYAGRGMMSEWEELEHEEQMLENDLAWVNQSFDGAANWAHSLEEYYNNNDREGYEEALEEFNSFVSYVQEAFDYRESILKALADLDERKENQRKREEALNNAILAWNKYESYEREFYEWVEKYYRDAYSEVAYRPYEGYDVDGEIERDNEIIDSETNNLNEYKATRETLFTQIANENTSYKANYTQMTTIRDSFVRYKKAGELKERAEESYKLVSDTYEELVNVLTNATQEPSEVVEMIESLEKVAEVITKYAENEKFIDVALSNYIEWGINDLDSSIEFIKKGFAYVEEAQKQINAAQMAYDNLLSIGCSEKTINKTQDLMKSINDNFYDVLQGMNTIGLHVLSYVEEAVADGTVFDTDYICKHENYQGNSKMTLTTHAKGVVNKTVSGATRIVINVSQDAVGDISSYVASKVYIFNLKNGEIEVIEIQKFYN